MNLVKNSRLDPSQSPLVKQNYGCSSKRQKGPPLALGFPPGFRSPGSHRTKTSQYPAMRHPDTAWPEGHQQSPSAVATGHL